MGNFCRNCENFLNERQIITENNQKNKNKNRFNKSQNKENNISNFNSNNIYNLTFGESRINNSYNQTQVNNEENLKIQEIMNKYEKKLNQKDEEIKKINQLTERLKNQYQQKINELNNQLNAKNNQYQQKINQLNNQLNLNTNQYKQKINELNVKNNQYQQKINELNLKNNQMVSISKPNNSLNGEIAKYKEEINKLQKEINNLKSEIIRYQNKIKILESGSGVRNEPINPKGLNNIGATCYMNATLQCLSNTPKLTDYFINKYISKSNNIMANEYHKVIINLWNDQKNTSYSPNSFKEVLSRENPLFAGIAANDSKDLINFLLERLHQELNETKSNSLINNSLQQDQTNEQAMLNLFLQDFKEKFNSPISNLFYGVMETKSKCHGCQIIKYNFQVYSFIEFPLQEVNKYCYNNQKRPLFNNDGSNPDVDLYECFEYYGKVDLMSGENQMYCNICKKLCNAFYSTVIYSTPNCLIINLNRGKGAVYECKVNFPEQLNLFNFVSYKGGITVYELYAVISHLGPSSMSGHFVAYCKYYTKCKSCGGEKNNGWYLFNDGIVTKCTQPYQYQNGMPYILFYKALRSS